QSMTTLVPTPSVLSDALLERCAQRAATYDRENRFFFEDFEELRQAGYLLIAVPKAFGGLGLSLAEICQEQRRLARRSAPTALATNMHLARLALPPISGATATAPRSGCSRKPPEVRYSLTVIRSPAMTWRSST